MKGLITFPIHIYYIHVQVIITENKTWSSSTLPHIRLSASKYLNITTYTIEDQDQDLLNDAYVCL